MIEGDALQPVEPTTGSNVETQRGVWRERFHLARDQGGLAILGGTILALILFLTIVVPYLSAFDAVQQNLTGRLQPPGWMNPDGLIHWFGTDGLGRDVFTRVFVGARFSLFIAVLAVAGSLVIGTVAGLVAGFRGGRIDDVLTSTPSVTQRAILASSKVTRSGGMGRR